MAVNSSPFTSSAAGVLIHASALEFACLVPRHLLLSFAAAIHRASELWLPVSGNDDAVCVCEPVTSVTVRASCSVRGRRVASAG